MLKFLDPKNDFVFKRLFGSEKNKDILMALLNDVLKNQLKSPIQQVSFLSPIQIPEVLAAKQSIVDVLCQDQLGVRYIVEMQVASTKGFEKRAQYYAAKAFISQMKEGGRYEGLDSVIFLAFTNFEAFPKKKAYKSEHVVLDKETHENDLDKLSFTFIELPKFNKYLKISKRKIEELSQEEKFYYFLYHAKAPNPDELSRIIQGSAIIEKAYKELNIASWTDEELAIYESEQKRLRDNLSSLEFAEEKGEKRGEARGLQKGIEQGKKEGKEEGLIEAIKGMAAAGASVEFIKQSLNLPEAAIREILARR